MKTNSNFIGNKKIVFVLGNYKNGGVSVRATNLANEFAKNGFTVLILVMGQLEETDLLHTRRHVQIISYCKYKKFHVESELEKKDHKKREKTFMRLKQVSRFSNVFPPFVRRQIHFNIRMYKQRNRLRSFFLENNDSIVIPFGMNYLDTVVSATEKLNCKIIYAEKNDPRTEYGSDINYAAFLLRKVSGIIVQTQDIKLFLEQHSLKKVHVINNPLKPGMPNPYSGRRRKTIVNFCRLNPQKNLELLIDAFELLQKSFPEYTLEIYGNIVDDSELRYKNQLAKKIEKSGLSNSIFLLPPAKDIHNIILDCTMFVSSSDFEGLSNSMIEAMAIGLPCICTDCLGGGTREVIQDRENGLIVPTNDVEALFRAMKEFIENPEFADQCGRNASKIRDMLLIERIGKQWLDVICFLS